MDGLCESWVLRASQYTSRSERKGVGTRQRASQAFGSAEGATSSRVDAGLRKCHRKFSNRICSCLYGFSYLSVENRSEYTYRYTKCRHKREINLLGNKKSFIILFLFE